jgi:hypothetical protein
MNAETRDRVQALISDFMGRWVADSISAEELERIAVEGVSPSGLLTPFHDALVPCITCSANAASPHAWAISTRGSQP